MATEAEIKAQERKELLDEIARKRAAAARSEGIVRAAEEGQYGDVGQGSPKGEFDDEMDQGRGNEDPTVSAIVQEPSFLDFPNALDLSKRGLAYLVQRRYPALIAADMATSIIPKATKEALSETLNKPFFPGLSNKLREALGFEPQYVMNADGSVSLTGSGNFDRLQMSKVGGSGGGKFMTPDQDSFLLKIIKQRLDEGESYGKLRGSVLEYLQDNPNLLEEAKKLGITDFTNTKIQDRLKNLFAGKITGREGYQLSEENQILIDAIKKFKPDDKESTLFTNYLKDNNLIKDVLSSNKNIDKKSLDRYLNFIRVSSPTTKRAIDGNFGKFIDEFALEIKDLKNTDSIFYKQYEYFKKFDKVRKEAGEKISPFLNKVFPSKTKNPAKNSLQIAHRFMNTQIGKSVPEGLAGTGGTPSTYYLDISRFNSEVQPLIEDQLRTALAKNDVKTLTKLDTQLKEELGAEVIVNGVKFGEHKSIEEKLLKLAQKYEANPKLMKQDGITLEMMRDLYEGIDIISKGASDLGIKMMSSGGIVGISHLTRPLRNF